MGPPYRLPRRVRVPYGLGKLHGADDFPPVRCVDRIFARSLIYEQWNRLADRQTVGPRFRRLTASDQFFMMLLRLLACPVTNRFHDPLVRRAQFPFQALVFPISSRTPAKIEHTAFRHVLEHGDFVRNLSDLEMRFPSRSWYRDGSLVGFSPMSRYLDWRLEVMHRVSLGDGSFSFPGEVGPITPQQSERVAAFWEAAQEQAREESIEPAAQGDRTWTVIYMRDVEIDATTRAPFLEVSLDSVDAYFIGIPGRSDRE